MPVGHNSWHVGHPDKGVCFGLQKPEHFPPVPCPRCGETMDLLWRKSGREHPCLQCPNKTCRLRVVLVVDGTYGLLPTWDPIYYPERLRTDYQWDVSTEDRSAILDVITRARQEQTRRQMNHFRSEENVVHTGTIAQTDDGRTEWAVLGFGACSSWEECGFTRSPGLAAAAADGLSTGGDTPLTYSMYVALRYLTNNGHGQTGRLIILCDGQDNCPERGSTTQEEAMAGLKTIVRGAQMPQNTGGNP